MCVCVCVAQRHCSKSGRGHNINLAIPGKHNRIEDNKRFAAVSQDQEPSHKVMQEKITMLPKPTVNGIVLRPCYGHCGKEGGMVGVRAMINHHTNHDGNPKWKEGQASLEICIFKR